MTTRFPLVAAQPGIWMAETLSALPNAWSVAHYVALHGTLDVDLLSRAIVSGLQQADTLRLRFGQDKGEIWQWLDQSMVFNPPVRLDLRAEHQPHDAAIAMMQQDLQQQLRADSGNPLVMHQLLQVADNVWYWYQRYHHLLVDGFSFLAISRQITAIYHAWQQGKATPISPFTPFADVVAEYQHYYRSEAYQRDRQFWAQQRQALPAPASISLLPLSSQPQSADIWRLSLTIDNNTIDRLAMQLPQCQRADLALALAALWLARLSGHMEYTAGYIFMRRIGSAALTASGPVINVLPLAVHINADDTLAELALRLNQQLKKIRRHQRYNAEHIVQDSGKAPDEVPLFASVFNVKLFDDHLQFAGIHTRTHTLATGPVNDLELALLPDTSEGLLIELLANKQRYQQSALSVHLQRLASIASQFAENPQLRCAEVTLLAASEYQQINKINHTRVAVPATTLSALVAAQAEKTPDAPALADCRLQLNYRELRQQTVALAQQLRLLGVQPGDKVAVALPRSVFLALALHGIVEAGAAWLPLDTGYPDERLHIMLTDAQPKLLITSAEQLKRFHGLAVTSFCYSEFLSVQDSKPLALSRPEHTAYLIFTSGSTGRPKGVMVGQMAIVNRLLWMQHQYPLTADDVVAQKTPCSFDVSVWEFWWPFIAGAKLVMAEPEIHRDPLALQQFFRQHGITTTHFVPSMLAVFISSLTADSLYCCRTLKRIFCSGEALPVALCRQWQQLTAIPLYNLYGPTEAAVDISYYPAYGAELAAVTGHNIPIGYPVWNCGLRILDAMLQPVPFGVTGDLYLTGVQLAQGYLGRPDLTSSRFIADPFAPGERMYRSGDVARWLENGAVEYLGRSDDQLKIRGQRIEPAEIEHVMRTLPDVAQAVIHACVLNQAALTEGDSRQLVGYVVSASGLPLALQTLQQQLRRQLPAHMVPVLLLQLSELPLSANGKLDRKLLPLPELTVQTISKVPTSDTEIAVARAFSQLLGCQINDVQADFFALGGHSLLAVRLAAQLSQHFAQPVTPGQIMVATTVEKLSALLVADQHNAHTQNMGYETILPLRIGKSSPAGKIPTLFCFHPASGFAWQFSVLSRYLDPHWSIIGIQSPRPDGAMSAATTLDDVCDQHLITLLTQQPHGPYYLLGYSLGGTLAQSIAARLQQRGEQVAFLGLLDTWPPETQNWSAKAASQPDSEVLAEIQRERAAFMAVQPPDPQNQLATGLFTAIENNYTDAIRLLSSAHSMPYSGKITLFVAQGTLSAELAPDTAWAPWAGELEIYPQDCSHVEIISPQAFKTIGPLIDRLITKLYIEQMKH